jgi:hypothetical protein
MNPDAKLGALTREDIAAARLRRAVYHSARQFILGRAPLPWRPDAGDDESADDDEPAPGTTQQERFYDGAVKHGAALDLD